MTTLEPTSSGELEERFKALMRTPVGDLQQYHEANQAIYAFAKELLADLEHTRQIIGEREAEIARLRKANVILTNELQRLGNQAQSNVFAVGERMGDAITAMKARLDAADVPAAREGK